MNPHETYLNCSNCWAMYGTEEDKQVLHIVSVFSQKARCLVCGNVKDVFVIPVKSKNYPQITSLTGEVFTIRECI